MSLGLTASQIARSNLAPLKTPGVIRPTMDEATPAEGESLSNTLLYGSAIAVVSGLYAVYVSLTGTTMTANAWFMLALGIVVLVHGLVLLTPRALGFSASGPLMIVYAALMLAHQVWLASQGGMGMGAVDAGMGWDGGMIALALLMLISGVIMIARGGTVNGRDV